MSYLIIIVNFLVRLMIQKDLYSVGYAIKTDILTIGNTGFLGLVIIGVIPHILMESLFLCQNATFEKWLPIGLVLAEPMKENFPTFIIGIGGTRTEQRLSIIVTALPSLEFIKSLKICRNIGYETPRR